MTAPNPPPPSEAALLPCPMCGSPGFLHAIEPHTHGPLAAFMPDHPGSAYVECTGCTVALSAGNEADAIAAWNRRAGLTIVAEGDGWLPIETAPRDGTRVLGFGPHDSRGHYINAVIFYRDMWTITWMTGYGEPTHWRPLPPPPKPEGAA